LRGGEFLRKLHGLAGRKGMSYLFKPSKGKGSHGKVYLGTASTIVKDRKKELGAGVLRQMCKDPGIRPEDL
jgi:hypothetical protein